VRAAAVTAAGAPGGDGTVGDEELFRFLHDPDAGVREACRAVLAAHGRTPEEVALGRRLTDPRPAERLRLLLDLAADTGRDVGPWLERLSRDPEPAVRAGAARVAAEVGLPFAAWLDQLAASDPDPLVRQVARYHKGRSSGLTPVGGP
jgi:HEAT repeat protein